MHRAGVCSPQIAPCIHCQRSFAFARPLHHSRAAATPHYNSTTDLGEQPEIHADPGLESFKALIAERRFLCTQCGKCCTGDGEVWISDEEAVRIAAYLGMPLQRLYNQHLRAYSKVEGFRMLRHKNNETRDCTFLQPDNTCAIHKVRPLQCSTYPWWPDLMNDQDWKWEKENICEGFDHPDAPATDKSDAAQQLRLATAFEYRKMLSRKPSKKQKAAAAPTTTPSSTIGPNNVATDITSSSGTSSSQSISDNHSSASSSDGSSRPAVRQQHAQQGSRQIASQASRPGPPSSAELHNTTQSDAVSAQHSSKAAAATWADRMARLQQQFEADDVCM